MNTREMIKKSLKPMVFTSLALSLIASGSVVPLFNQLHSTVAYAATWHGYDNPIEGATLNVSKKNTPENPAYPNNQDLKDNSVHAAYLSGSNAFVLYSDDYTGVISQSQYMELQGLKDGYYKVKINIDTTDPTPVSKSPTKSTSPAKTGSSSKTTTKKNTANAVRVLYTGYSTTYLNVRSSGSLKGKKIGLLKRGDSVQVVKDGSWLKIKYKSGYAYVSKYYVSKNKPTLYTSTISKNTVVRTGAGTKYKTLGSVKKGSRVSVVKAGTWVEIKYGKSYGYILASMLKTKH